MMHGPAHIRNHNKFATVFPRDYLYFCDLLWSEDEYEESTRELTLRSSGRIGGNHRRLEGVQVFVSAGTRTRFLSNTSQKFCRLNIV